MTSYNEVHDNPMISARLQEKEQLQGLNQRFTSYINIVRSKREKEKNEGGATTHDQKYWQEQVERMRTFYEDQINELQGQLERTQREKSELEASRAKYDAMSAEFENRIMSLNERVQSQNQESIGLQVQVSDKDVELQQLRSQMSGPQQQLEACRMERDDLQHRLAETERRCSSEQRDKMELQNQFMEFQNRCSHELQMYQQEIGNLHGSLEKSRQLALELEEAAHKSGQQDNDVVVLLRQAREKSEIELRRYMDESESKHNLNISEIKMQMRADSEQLVNLMEENGRLTAHVTSLSAQLQEAKSQLTSAEASGRIAQTNLESERTNFQSQIHKLERKLEETQNMLLVKIQELGAAQDANVPLQTEIELLKNLIEEEEKRLGLMSNSYTNLKATDDDFNQLENYHRCQTPHSRAHSARSDAMTSSASGARRHRPSSVPIATNGFARAAPGSNGAEVFHAPLASSRVSSAEQALTRSSDMSLNMAGDSPAPRYAWSDLKQRGVALDTDQGDEKPGLDHLPSPPASVNGGADEAGKPVDPLPRRPASAASARYIPADAGEGRDYFDAMFHDVRKEAPATCSSRVTSGGGDASSSRKAMTSSTQHDLQNSTASHDVQASKNGRLWYSGSTASATGNMKLVQVDENGQYVRVHNASGTRTEDIGGCLLQQNVAGHPVAVFRFPPRTKLLPGHTATVWSARAGGVHDPPSHYVWKQLDKWGTGPECTTILCKPNGQAIAWMTSAPRVSRISRAYQYHSKSTGDETKHPKSSDFKSVPAFNDDARQIGTEDQNGEGYLGSRVALYPYPSTYTTKPVVYADSPPSPQPPPILKRGKTVTHSALAGNGGGGMLANRTGSAPLRKYTAPPSPLQHSSKTSANQRKLVRSELVELTAQKSARAKYGFDFMTHPPKVVSYDGTVRER